MINIVKIYKIEIKTKWSEDDIYIYPTSFDVTLGLQGCKILDALYSIVPISYNDGTTFLEFNLSGFTDFQKSNFVSYVESKGLEIQLDYGMSDKYEDAVSVLIDQMMPLRKELITSWLKKTKVLIEGELLPVDAKAYDRIRKNMTERENEDLAALFLIDDKDLNPIASRSVPFTMSLHSKNGLDYDAIGELDLYMKIHDEVIEPSLILFNNDEADTMTESKYLYELPFPSNTLYKKNEFNEEEVSQYKELYEMLDEDTEECVIGEFGEYSKIGGYFEEDIAYATINHDPFDYDRDWKHLLMLSCYSHPCDFFQDIGGCHANIMVIESKKEGMVVMESRIILNYT